MSQLDPVKYATSLAKTLTNEIGFVPITRYEDAHGHGRLLIQRLNEEPCGFLIHGPPNDGRIHVWQTAVQIDARRQAAATDLVHLLKLYALTKDAREIILRCRDELDANHFWQACGFQLYKTSNGGKARGRIVNHYSLLLPTKQKLLFPAEVEQCPHQPDRISRQTAVSKLRPSPLFKQRSLL
jgi:GNAT superfamily N-acetyltransferase